jgi:hypothetical protein
MGSPRWKLLDTGPMSLLIVVPLRSSSRSYAAIQSMSNRRTCHIEQEDLARATLN